MQQTQAVGRMLIMFLANDAIKRQAFKVNGKAPKHGMQFYLFIYFSLFAIDLTWAKKSTLNG